MNLAEIASAAAVVVSLYSIFAQRRKVSADANEINTRANVSLLKPLTDRVDELERELAEERRSRKADNDQAMRLITELQGQLRERDQVIANQNTVILDLQTQITALKRGQNSGGVMR